MSDLISRQDVINEITEVRERILDMPTFNQMNETLISRSDVLQLIADELEMLESPIVDADPVTILLHLTNKIFNLPWYQGTEKDD